MRSREPETERQAEYLPLSRRTSGKQLQSGEDGDDHAILDPQGAVDPIFHGGKVRLEARRGRSWSRVRRGRRWRLGVTHRQALRPACARLRPLRGHARAARRASKVVEAMPRPPVAMLIPRRKSAGRPSPGRSPHVRDGNSNLADDGFEHHRRRHSSPRERKP